MKMMWKRLLLLIMVAFNVEQISSGQSKNKVQKHIRAPAPPLTERTVIKRLNIFGAVIGVVNDGVSMYYNAKHSQEQTEILENTKKLETAVRATDVKVNQALNQQMHTINLLKKLPQILQDLLLRSDLRKHLIDMQTMHKDFAYHSIDISKFDKHTLTKFAKTLVSHGFNSVHFLIVQMGTIIIPPHKILRRVGILEHLAQTIKDAPMSNLCSFKLSKQQIFYHFYGNLLFARIRGFTMKMFGYSTLKLFGDGSDFDAEVEILKDEVQLQIKKEFPLVEKLLKGLPNEILLCDPKVHVRGQTFVEVTKLEQGFVVNQFDLQGCRGSCGDFKESYRNVGCITGKSICKRQEPCNGEVLNCGGSIYDPSNVYLKKHGDHGRRYSLVKSPNYVYGKEEELETGDDVIKVEGWTATRATPRFLIWAIVGIVIWKNWPVPVMPPPPATTYYCNYCLCHCNDITKSDRYFNLRPAMANYTKNHVVTGLRFVKHNRVIHLQIQAGKLLQNGHIVGNSVKWVPLDHYQLSDKRNVKEGVDYVTVDGPSRDINLDDIIAEKGNVIVGVRLIGGKGPLTLSLATAAFNFTKEVLTFEGEGPEWITSNLTANRVRIDMIHRGKSFVANSSSESHKNPARTRFGPSGWREDAAQTTIPSLDAQPVVSPYPMPLQGAGLYWKGKKDHGGFIAPKIFIYDLLYYIKKNSSDKM